MARVSSTRGARGGDCSLFTFVVVESESRTAGCIAALLESRGRAIEKGQDVIAMPHGRPPTLGAEGDSDRQDGRKGSGVLGRPFHV